MFWHIVTNEKQLNEPTKKISQNKLTKTVQSKFSTFSDKKKNLAPSISYEYQTSNSKDFPTKFSKSSSPKIFQTNNSQKHSYSNNHQRFSNLHSSFTKSTNVNNRL